MTIEDKIKELLIEHGMWGIQLDDVLAEYKANAKNEKFVPQRWGDDIEGYPAVYLGSLWYSVKLFAYAWLQENYPKAFYLPLFDQEEV